MGIKSKSNDSPDSSEIKRIDDEVNKTEKKNKTRVIIRTVVRFVLFAIVSFIIGTSIYKINAKNLMHDEMPMIFGYSTSVILSGSMEPTLSVDDLIVVKKFDDSEYKVGDPVVFQENTATEVYGVKRRDGKCVVHRIIAINSDGTLVTQGDANNSADEPITYDQIKGKVIFVVPAVGKVVEVIKSPIVVIPAVALIFFLIMRSYKKDEESKKTEVELLQEEINLLKMQKEIEELKKDKSEKKKKDEKESEE